MASDYWLARQDALQEDKINLQKDALAWDKEKQKRNARLDRWKKGKNFENVSDRLYKGAFAVNTGLSAWSTLKPLLIGVIVLFLLLGPGLSAVLIVFNTFNVWIWVGIIAILVLWWRNR